MDVTNIILSIGGLAVTVYNTWLMFVIKSLKEDLAQVRLTHVEEMNTLRQQHAESSRELAAIQVLVAGQYVTRIQFNDAMKQQTDLVMGRLEDLFRYLKPRTGSEGVRGS